MLLDPATAVDFFAKAADHKTIAAGDKIFTIHEQGTVMYGILEGEVELQVDGKVVETIAKGDVFGEGALVQEPPLRASTAIAKTDCKLALMDRDHFLFLVQETPLFALQTIHSLSNRLRQFKAGV